MKHLFLTIFTACILSNITAQDTISFTYPKTAYELVADEHLHKIYYNQEVKTHTPDFVGKYMLQSLETVSIPVLYLKNKTFTCGDNLEAALSLTNDTEFQKVIVVAKKEQKKVGGFDIFHSYRKYMFELFYKDITINGIPLSPLIGQPVLCESGGVERKLLSHIVKHPNDFVFMITGFHGYWVIRNGNVFKLKNGLGKLTLKDGSKYICLNYGQEYINDAIKNSIRSGGYMLCATYKKSSNKVFVEIKTE